MKRTDILNSIFVVSAMIDMLILAEIARAMKPSVVGKTIIPQDNSYATSLETGCNARVYGKKFVCLSEPYVKEIEPLFKGGPTHKVEMVKVRSVETDREYEVMFAEEFLVSEE